MKYCEDCKFFGIEVEEKFFGLIHRNEEVCLHPSAAYGANQYKNNFRNVYTRRPIRIKHWPANLMRSMIISGDRCGEEAKHFELNYNKEV
jgi:hypothetical protein